MKAFWKALAALLGVVAIVVAATVYAIARRGLSTRTEPSQLEELVARSMRRLAMPSAVRSMANPVEPTEAVLQEGLEHFADHCAVCHANDGSGDTEMGRGLYPRAPDMRVSPTQDLTDGELFSIIENGVRLTGMPAWGTGTPEGERASWALVHFVRRLPRLTDEEIGRMQALNPRSADEWQREEEIRRFLAGEEVSPSPTPPNNGDHLH
ncbi:MAG: cytochrome c [Vicinamibacterales bacterium]